jgi:hypothetical protein
VNPRFQLAAFLRPTLLVSTCAVSLLAACARQSQDPQSQAKMLFDACVNAMVSDTCRVMQSAGSTLVPPGTTLIFVAGIGPIDAALYTKLRESGEGMCTHLRQVCEKDWTGQQCRTARTLYGVDAPSG